MTRYPGEELIGLILFMTFLYCWLDLFPRAIDIQSKTGCNFIVALYWALI